MTQPGCNGQKFGNLHKCFEFTDSQVTLQFSLLGQSEAIHLSKSTNAAAENALKLKLS
jgi:hypothetical protein